MSQVDEIVRRLRAEWEAPRTVSHEGVPVPVPLRCSFEPPATETEIQFVATQIVVPPQVLEFWRASNGARLFEDERYGQWGLHLYSAQESMERTSQFAQERPSEVQQADLVIGEFFGDSDLVIVRCDSSLNSYGSIVIALPLDQRADWDPVSGELSSFLSHYASTHGEKFWRKRNTTSSSS